MATGLALSSASTHALSMKDRGTQSSVYISGLASFLPNEPVTNDEIEDVLGLVGSVPSRVKRRILKSNGIQTRHYAIDRETGKPTHTNAELTAEVVRRLCENTGVAVEEIDCLVCGTATPDQWIPNHGSMVHGALGSPPAEVVATTGVCLCGITALKYGVLNVLGGYARRAVVTATEVISANTCAASFRSDTPGEGRKNVVPFDQEFLRWMLSDGGGAALLTPEPHPTGTSFRVEWIEIVSYAGELETCMYWGGAKQEDGSLVGWHRMRANGEASKAMHIAQDARLLGREVGKRSINHAFTHVLERRAVTPDQIDWFVPHYSSEFFREEVHDRFVEIGFPLPYEKWFNNLPTKGNTGSASIYIMLDELLRSDRLEDGQTVLCFVPESARFSAGYVLLTVEKSG